MSPVSFHSRLECGFGYIIIRSPYNPFSIYLRGTIYYMGTRPAYTMGPGLRFRAEAADTQHPA